MADRERAAELLRSLGDGAVGVAEMLHSEHSGSSSILPLTAPGWSP